MSVIVSNLNKSIGKNQILTNINLSITQNGVVGLLGPNGAGKSTLMKILIGLWDYDSGEIEVCGEKGEKNSKKRLLPHRISQYIGYLPEDNPLYEDMYVREYLQFMLSLNEEQLNSQKSKQVVEELITEVGLTAMAHKRIRELSKGYRQRVGIAQAISGNPQLLILDEPTTGLDPNQLDEIRTLIQRLGERRIVILSTHILQEVQAICDRVIILAKGEVREDTIQLDNLEQLFREKTK